MYEAVLSWIEAHPATFAVVASIAVPTILSALSFLDGWAAKRWPVAVAIARALLPDVKRVVAIAASGALESRKLPVPPEVRALTVERVERAISQRPTADPDRTPVGPRRIPPLPCLLLLLALALVDCGADTQTAVHSANEIRTAGHAYADVVDAVCTKPAERAAELPEDEAGRELARLQALHCSTALLALTAYSEAHRTLHDLIEAIQAGQCTPTIARDVPEKCDLFRASAKAVDAGVALARAVDELQRGAR